MIEVKGKYNSAKIFNEYLEDMAQKQIKNLLDHIAFKGSKIRIMPDVHAGAGCVIGFTANIKERVVPNLVGVDIGCGMLTTKLGKVDIDFKKLDDFIRKNIPNGFNSNSKPDREIIENEQLFIETRRICERVINKGHKREICGIGSLGGGNHFIEVNEDKRKNKYLVIHSGSRNFGWMIADVYQKKAVNYCKSKVDEINKQIRDLGKSNSFKKHDKRYENVTKKIEKLEKEKEIYSVSKDLSFLEGRLKDEYLHDMQIAQKFATLNRYVMRRRILEFLKINLSVETFETVHNYINFEDHILRKGAISANKNELVLIPLNMADGSIIAKCKGNSDWNCSAPHGAGRVMSRKKAKANLNMHEFEKKMDHVWSTCIKKSTLDEAPMAYKNATEIIKYIHPTADIVEIIKPIYNFKAN